MLWTWLAVCLGYILAGFDLIACSHSARLLTSMFSQATSIVELLYCCLSGTLGMLWLWNVELRGRLTFWFRQGPNVENLDRFSCYSPSVGLRTAAQVWVCVFMAQQGGYFETGMAWRLREGGQVCLEVEGIRKEHKQERGTNWRGEGIWNETGGM